MKFQEKIDELTARLHGLATTETLHVVGLAEDDVYNAVRHGHLVRETPRVLRAPGAPRTEAQRVLSGVLDAGEGAVLSHRAAAAWWGIPGYTLDVIEVSRPRPGPRRPERGTKIHGRVLLPEHHVCTLEGIPVAVPARVLLDLAGDWGIHDAKLARTIDNAWSMRLVSGPTLHRTFHELRKQGRHGIVRMRAMLKERPVDYIPPATGLEGRFREITEEIGMEFRRQVDSGDDDHWIGRVDFRHVSLPLIVEVQSERFHTSLSNVADDAARIADLERASYIVEQFSDTDVWQRPATVRARLTAAVAALTRSCARKPSD